MCGRHIWDMRTASFGCSESNEKGERRGTVKYRAVCYDIGKTGEVKHRPGTSELRKWHRFCYRDGAVALPLMRVNGLFRSQEASSLLLETVPSIRIPPVPQSCTW